MPSAYVPRTTDRLLAYVLVKDIDGIEELFRERGYEIVEVGGDGLPIMAPHPMRFSCCCFGSSWRGW